MSSKKRIFYNAPQKRIKQKYKDRYTNTESLPKLKRFRKSLEFSQKEFMRKKFRSYKYFPNKAIYSFYSNLVKPTRVLARKYKYFHARSKLLSNLVRVLRPESTGVVFRLTRKGATKLYKEYRTIAFLNYCFTSIKSLYKLEFEAQTLFQLGNSTQQYYLNTLGINYPYFTCMTSGRTLRHVFGQEVSKSLKKSFKLNKTLVDYYFFAATFDHRLVQYTHTYIKPLNKKALILLSQIQDNSDYYHTFLGFRKYYKTNFKTSRRIKKRIKKKIVSDNFKYQPYRHEG